MEVPSSPGTMPVGGILIRGEDTDGEQSDIEVDYPPESYVSQLDGPAGEEPSQDGAAELEVTGEGTAGGPFGLKKILFVKKRDDSSKTLGSANEDNKPQETFKEKVSKLGTGVSERFAALGSIMQDHTSKTGVKHADVSSQHSDRNMDAPPPPSAAEPDLPTVPKRALEYFKEYEMTFTSKPEFSVVAGPAGKGAVVAWPEKPTADSPTAASSPVGDGFSAKNSVPTQVPPAGAVILTIGGEPVVDAEPEHVQVLLSAGSPKAGEATATTEASETTSTEQVANGSEAPTPEEGAENATFSMVIRFREKAGPMHDGDGPGGAPGGEFFRKAGKAMATGFGNLFQPRDGVGSVVRDGSEVGVRAGSLDGRIAPETPVPVASDIFVLTFAAQDGTAESLPFSMAEMIGGRGVVVSAVRDGYTATLIKPTEVGVSAAGTAGIAGDEVADSTGEGRVEALTPGAVLLRVAGQNAEGKSLAVVEKMMEAAAAEHSAVKILFRCAPPIYRASVAAELALEGANKPYVHVGTWQPLLKRRAGVTIGGGDGENGGSGGSVIGIGYGGEEWEDVRETMARAHQFVNGFRSIGIRVDVISMQTVTLPRNVKSAYVGTFESRLSSFQQAVRLWFSFPDEKTVSIRKDSSSGIMGLTPVETRGTGATGSWVTATAVEGSPCAEAGIPVGENCLLTHVNGFDVSPAAYRSLAPVPFGGGEGWAAGVLPAMEEGGRDGVVTVTFV